MSLCVIDTNVILAANESHENLSPDCIATCASRLLDIKSKGTVIIDDKFRILSEYQNKTDSRGGKKPGDAFLKWLLQNSANPKYCIRVALTEQGPDIFDEFPVKTLENFFDPSDRKFVAVANAHPSKPTVLQAADCKWLDWQEDLRSAGIEIEFICLDDVRRFYAKKFPDKPTPSGK